jgi:hypothetical protein
MENTKMRIKNVQYTYAGKIVYNENERNGRIEEMGSEIGKDIIMM